jgi:hypothetical protein
MTSYMFGSIIMLPLHVYLQNRMFFREFYKVFVRIMCAENCSHLKTEKYSN